MASTPIGFPLTYDATQGGPRYAAADFRLTAGAGMAVPDGTPFGAVQGVRAGSPSPLVRASGTTVTVAAHMGWLCPWAGNGCYAYALPSPVSRPIGSTSGSYKIAVVLDDKAAGHGTGEKVDVNVYPASTTDTQIPGLVVARVDAGIASDLAPVISQDATIRVGTLDRLTPIAAADGVGAVLADGTRYERRSGSWVSTQERIQTGTVDIRDPKLKVTRLERIGRVVHLTGAINEPNAPNGYVYGYIPEGYRPAVAVHITEGDASGVDGQVAANGAISYTSKAGFNRWIDRTWLA